MTDLICVTCGNHYKQRQNLLSPDTDKSEAWFPTCEHKSTADLRAAAEQATNAAAAAEKTVAMLRGRRATYR